MGEIREVGKFQSAIIAWFESEGVDYPWRQTRDPYAILVSEMMLQQTQIASVLGRGYYQRWMQQFPNVASLAEAPEEQILRCWEGLGYYNRARNLQKAARVVMEKLGGQFPRTVEGLLELPGLGKYTAGAVLSFAYDQPAPIVDANIARVLARICDLQSEVDAEPGRSQLWEWAEQLVPPREARAFNSGLMELGQKICSSTRPDCLICPVRSFCSAKNPESLPIKRPKRQTVLQTEHVIWSLRNGCLLLYQEAGSRRRGLWKLPARQAEETDQTMAPILLKTNYSITHHRVTLLVHDGTEFSASANEVWQPLGALPDLPMPGPFRRVVDRLLPSQ